jgi:hypothetical protein
MLLIFVFYDPDDSLNIQDPDYNLLSEAKGQVVIDGINYRLTAYAWRDYMPSGNPDSSLKISIMIEAINQTDFPDTVDFDEAWIINSNDSEMWVVNLPQEYDVWWPNNIVKKVRHNGPYWNIGASLDVIVRIVSQDSYYFLKTLNVIIERTD